MTARGWAWAAVTVAVATFFGARAAALIVGVAVCRWWLDRVDARPSRVERRRRNLARIVGPAWTEPCRYCGQPAESWDHKIPLSRGGTDHPSNLVPACTRCNSSKNDRSPEEWWADIGQGRPYPENWPQTGRWQTWE